MYPGCTVCSDGGTLTERLSTKRGLYAFCRNAARSEWQAVESFVRLASTVSCRLFLRGSSKALNCHNRCSRTKRTDTGHGPLNCRHLSQRNQPCSWIRTRRLSARVSLARMAHSIQSRRVNPTHIYTQMQSRLPAWP